MSPEGTATATPPPNFGLPGVPNLPPIPTAPAPAPAPAAEMPPAKPPMPPVIRVDQPPAPQQGADPTHPTAATSTTLTPSRPSTRHGAGEDFNQRKETRPMEAVNLAHLGLSQRVEQGARMLMAEMVSPHSGTVAINGPKDVFRKVNGRFELLNIDLGDSTTYHLILNEVLFPYVNTPDRLDGTNVLVEGQMLLPTMDTTAPPIFGRVHALLTKQMENAAVTVAKKAQYELTLDDMTAGGALTTPMANFLRAMAEARLTFVVSGPTGAGKSTLLQAVAHSFDPAERIVVIEDNPELSMPPRNTVYLPAEVERPGLHEVDMVRTEWLVKGAQRMRMDRIIVGECRGAEMADWLIAANSGADGSATTVHADNPRRTLDKILNLASKSKTTGTESTLLREIAATVDIVVQAGLVNGKHVITHIEEVSSTVTTQGVMVTSTIFEYDRTAGTWRVNRPTDQLQALFAERGVPLDPTDFAQG